MMQGFMPPDLSQQKQLLMPGTEQPQPEQNNLAKMLEKFRQEDKTNAQEAEAKKEAATLQGAGIQAGTSLLGGLLAQQAQAQQARQQAELETGKAVAETQAKGMQTAAQAQQDAFTRLMGSMRSAMVR
jgi:hypothetical protein